ncbi:MAG: hypothetical protein H0V47_13010 [Chloroflexia bacterium]|nr:hypothetical protein [Chloroflexia bacterium]
MRERWDGPHWRWWALTGGIGMVVLTFVLVTLASTVLDQSIAALLTLVLLAELLILSMMGSGMLSATSRRMSRGGLARETATLDVDYAARARSTFEKERDRDARDRRTIRYAIMLLPVLVACVYLLAR